MGKGKKLMSGMISVAIVVSGFAGVTFSGARQAKAEEEGKKLSAPLSVKNSNMKTGRVMTWDCIWFGSYPQAEVFPASKEYIETIAENGELIKDVTLYQQFRAAT